MGHLLFFALALVTFCILVHYSIRAGWGKLIAVTLGLPAALVLFLMGPVAWLGVWIALLAAALVVVPVVLLGLCIRWLFTTSRGV